MFCKIGDSLKTLKYLFNKSSYALFETDNCVKIIFAIIKNNLFTVLTFALTLHTERWVKLYPDPHQGSGTRLYQLMYSSLPHAPREKITNLT